MHIYDKKHHIKTGTLINESFMIILLTNWSNEIHFLHNNCKKKKRKGKKRCKTEKKQHIFTFEERMFGVFAKNKNKIIADYFSVDQLTQ